jgi:SAM-dependent methyltransferase
MAEDWFRALRCPLDGAELERAEHALTCETCGRAYPLRGGIPDFVDGMPSASASWAGAQRYELTYWERAGAGRLAEQAARFEAAAGSLAETFDRFAEGADWRRRVLQVGTAGMAELHHLAAAERYAAEPLACALQAQGLLSAGDIRWVACMGEHLPFPDGHFSLALIPNVLDHTADPARVLAELRRCLRGDGLLWLSAHVSHAALLPAFGLLGRLRLGYFAGHPWYFSRGSLRDAADAAGFEVRMERYESAAGGVGARGLRAHVKARLLGVQYLLLSPR